MFRVSRIAGSISHCMLTGDTMPQDCSRCSNSLTAYYKITHDGGNYAKGTTTSRSFLGRKLDRGEWESGQCGKWSLQGLTTNVGFTYRTFGWQNQSRRIARAAHAGCYAMAFSHAL